MVQIMKIKIKKERKVMKTQLERERALKKAADEKKKQEIEENIKKA